MSAWIPSSSVGMGLANKADNDFDQWIATWTRKYKDTALKIVPKNLKKSLEKLTDEEVLQIVGMPTAEATWNELRMRVTGQMITLPKDHGSWWNMKIGEWPMNLKRNCPPQINECLQAIETRGIEEWRNVWWESGRTKNNIFKSRWKKTCGLSNEEKWKIYKHSGKWWEALRRKWGSTAGCLTDMVGDENTMKAFIDLTCNKGHYAMGRKCNRCHKTIESNWHWLDCLDAATVETSMVEQWKWRHTTGTTTPNPDTLDWLK